jgi:hypothetical protein
MPHSPTPRLAFGLDLCPPGTYSCVYHLASLPSEAFGCVIGPSFGAEFPLGAGIFRVSLFPFVGCFGAFVFWYFFARCASLLYVL